MADILIDNQVGPTTPAAGKSIIFVDSSTKKLSQMDDAGLVQGILSRNSITTSLALSSTDFYITNSGLLIPSFGMKAGMLFRWIITGSKTGAGTAQAIYTVRTGSNQTTSDVSRLAMSGVAQTATIDNGTLVVTAQVRNVGASGVIAGGASWAKTQTGITGLGGSIDGVSGSFDNSAMAGLYCGLSINAGASSAWTFTSVHAELIG